MFALDRTEEFEMLQRYKILSLYHFTHIDNLESILKKGLLPHEEMEKQGVKFNSIADLKVKNIRKMRSVHLYNYYETKKVSQCVPLYISVKNPMLYKVLYGYKKPPEDIIHIKIDILKVIRKNYCFFDGNAASHGSLQYINLENLKKLNWSVIRQDGWNNTEEKREKCAEFLVYPKLDFTDFYQIIVYNNRAEIKTKEILDRCNIQLKGGVKIYPGYYNWSSRY